MRRIRDRVVKLLMIVTLGLLPGGTIDCDMEDGELDIDFDDCEHWEDCHGGGYEVWTYDCYSCWW